MVSILRRYKVLSCVLIFHRYYERFFWSKDLIILTISSTHNSKDISLVSELIFTGTVLSLDIGVHCLAKKLLNRLALSKKSVRSLLSTSSGDISGILLPFKNIFKIFQYVLALFSNHLFC